MEVLKWLAVGVFGMIVIAVIAIAAFDPLQTVGGNMVAEIENQVNSLINLR